MVDYATENWSGMFSGRLRNADGRRAPPRSLDYANENAKTGQNSRQPEFHVVYEQRNISEECWRALRRNKQTSDFVYLFTEKR